MGDNNHMNKPGHIGAENQLTAAKYEYPKKENALAQQRNGKFA